MLILCEIVYFLYLKDRMSEDGSDDTDEKENGKVEYAVLLPESFAILDDT